MGVQPSHEPLTGREREILALLCQSLSDQEIADHLVLGVNTVKWYNRQIYAKLGVRKRRDAIRQAVALGLHGAADAAGSAATDNLPAALTPFVGRSVELAEIRGLLSHPHTRLLTILAPGGMGKTRLALEAAYGLLDQYPDGVYYAALAGLTASDQFAPAVAEALSYQFMPDGRPSERQLADVLRRKHLLLVLDNFEHLLDAGPLVTALLSAAPHLKILVTSREKLSLTGESVYPLAGLHYPEASADEPLRYGAVQLFIECAMRANPHFATNDVEHVAAVCRLAQGMPLAIELAAAWAGSMPAAEIACEIEKSADFLHTDAADVPERLRSVRAVFEAAWARLDDDERYVFRWLSVFRGGCTREAAQAVTGATPAVLASLVSKALLWRNAHTHRYEVHELLRQYAEAELEKAGETEAARLAHLRYYGPLAYEWSRAMPRGKQIESFANLDIEIDNVRHAMAYATGRGVPDELGQFSELTAFYDRHGWWAELIEATSAAIQRLEPNDSVALARMMQSKCIAVMRLTIDPQLVYDLSKRSLEMLLRLDALGVAGAREALPRAYLDLDIGLTGLDRTAEGAQLLLNAEPLFVELNDPFDLPTLNHHLADTAMWASDFETAEARGQAALRIYTHVGNYWAMVHSLSGLGKTALLRGEYTLAEERILESLALARMIEFHLGIEWGMADLAMLSRARRDWQAARGQLGEVLRMQRQKGFPDHVLFRAFTLLAEASVMLDEADEAQSYLREAVTTFSDRTAVWDVRLCVLIAGLYLTLRRGFEQAAAFWGHLDGRGGAFDFEVDKAELSELESRCRAALSPDEFAAAAERGKTLSPDAVIAELLPFL